MKKIISMALIAVILLCFVGCAKLINTETQEVDATVTDVHYRCAWTQMVWSGKVMIPIIHPAEYKVTFTYQNVTLTVNDKNLYDSYKDNIGTIVKCDLITKYYDNGNIHLALKLKENNK